MQKTTNTLNLENLLTYFQSKNENVVIQEETDQLLITVKVEKVEFPLFIRVSENQDLLQLLAFFPCNTKEGCEADTALTLHLLNKDLDIPGFGMDDLNGLIFYRCMVPCLDNQYQEAVVDKFFNAVKRICQSFLPLIYAMSQGNIKYQDIQDQMPNLMPTNDQ